MDVIIRPYVETDFDALTEVWFASWKSVGVGFPAPSLQTELRERLPREIANGWSVHVAIIESDVIGFIALQNDRLQQLFVAPNMQGRGIGKRLLDFVKVQRPHGFWLTTPTEGQAVRFYESEGLERGPISMNLKFGHEVVRYDWRP